MGNLIFKWVRNNVCTVSTQLNGFNYCYLTQLLFNINHLFTHSELITSIAIKHLFYSTLFIHLHIVKWFKVLKCKTNISI